MSDGLMAYFGYGSLVNLDSLRTKYIAAYPARLKGWRRHWQSRDSGDNADLGVKPALLSIHRHSGTDSYIHGMLIIDRLENRSVLDEREKHYQRVLVGDDLELVSVSQDLQHVLAQHQYVYVAHENPHDQAPLLQSYLDVVMTGFDKMNGKKGVEDFIASTTGFKRPIITDRRNPYYPRAIAIEKKKADWFDGLLRDAGVQYE